MDGLFVCGVTEKASGDICQWQTKDITYAITGYIPQFSQDQYRSAVRRAFDAWEAVCGIHANEVTSTDANIMLSVGRGRRNNFDGPSGVLAWCEIPCGNVRQCQLRMDLDETWTDKVSDAGIFVDAVLAHELGHGIGIYHIDSGTALMNPIYNKAVSKPLALDIAQGTLRYGEARPRTPQPPVTPPTGKTVKAILYTDGTWVNAA